MSYIGGISIMKGTCCKAIDRFLDRRRFSSSAVVLHTCLGFLSSSTTLMAMATTPPDLPSKVEEILSLCPKFRILLVGNSGVGKSLLVSSVFNINKTETDVQHDRAGTANIEREYNYPSNPRFILHDSRGFEPGSHDNLKIVTEFLQHRCNTSKNIRDRLHAIWLCLETPLPGSRLLEHGNEEILRIITENQKLDVAVVVVFTKFDNLIKYYFEQLLPDGDSMDDTEKKAIESATSDLQEHITILTRQFPEVYHAKVFADEPDETNSDLNDVYLNRDSLVELTDITLELIQDVFEEELWILWIMAQQINAKQKVIGSIEQGLKKYWIDLGRNAIFDHRPLINCLARIHDDIIYVWFDDPDEVPVLLTKGKEFHDEMLRLISELRPNPESRDRPFLSSAANIAQIGSLFGRGGPPLFAVGTAGVASAWAYEKYKNTPTATLCLGAYIADLILVLREVFRLTRETRTPRLVSKAFAFDALHIYEHGDAKDVHQRVREIANQGLLSRPELEVTKLIKEKTGIEETAGL